MLFCEILFWFSIICIFYHYLVYPLIIKLLSRSKSENTNVFLEKDSLPKVSILMSVFNEEKVIFEKIESVFETNYPLEKLELIVGSDNSVDKTNDILLSLSPKYNSLQIFIFQQRQGKINIINNLVEKTNGEILILTDANVFFEKKTIFELVKHFKNAEIGLVGSNIINIGINQNGISLQESFYTSRESQIKHNEGNIWGTMMGPFGGCFAMRKNLFQKVPPNFLVDDFFINMKVLEQEKKSINSLSAKVYEDVSNHFREEFRRKVRISTGNFQNLYAFFHLFFRKNKLNFGLGFSFLSHKVLRWLGPFFLILIFFTNIFLLFQNKFYLILFFIYIFSFFIPFFDFLLKKISFNISFFRFISHFYGMNFALFIGFFRYLKGVKSSIWKPTERNQTKN